MTLLKMLLVCVVTVVLTVIGTPAVTAQEPEITAPVPTVPGISTIEGLYTIIAYNSEGWVTLGYRTANDRQDQNWVMLEVGLTLRSPADDQTLKRSSFTLTSPDGSTVPLPTQEEFLEAWQMGELAFLPPSADMSCHSRAADRRPPHRATDPRRHRLLSGGSRPTLRLPFLLRSHDDDDFEDAPR